MKKLFSSNKIKSSQMIRCGGLRKWSLLLYAFSISSTGSVNVLAVDGGAFSLEEIVVTARKKEESLQDVPITINAFSGASLREQGIDDIELIEENTPGFTFDYLGGTRARPTIRGIGSDETGPGGDPSSGVFLDGVYLGRGGQQAVDAYDMERVEVLQGPQGTLFGRNVVGGAVSFITNKPTDEVDARLALTLGNYQTIDTEGFFNLPAADKLKLRFAFSMKDNEGFGINNFTGNRLDVTERRSARLNALYEPSERVSFLLSTDITRDDTVGRVGNQTGRPNSAANTPSVDTDGSFANRAEIDGFAKRDHWGITLTTNIEFDSAILTNIASFRHIDESGLEDADGFNRIENPTFRQTTFGFADDADIWSNELRLAGDAGALDWTVGVYFSKEEIDGNVILQIDNDGATSTTDPYNTNFLSSARSSVDSKAVFGEMSYVVTDKLNLSAGARYTKDTKDFAGSFSNDGGNTLVFDFDAASVNDVTFSDVTWRVSADYRIVEDTLAYLTVSTGYKSGAFPLIAFSPTTFTTVLAPETATNYEVGLKSDLFDDRVRANLSIFTTDFEDLQIVQVTGSAAANALSAPTAEINGVELDLTAYLTEALLVKAKYTYLDAEYGAITVSGTNFAPGLQVIRTPKNDYSLSVRYEKDLGESGRYYILPQVSYRSEVFDDPDNNLEELRPERTIVNLNVGWISPSDKWEGRAYGKNLTDEDYFNRVTNIGGVVGQRTSGPP